MVAYGSSSQLKRSVGPYDLERRLGRGGMGEVWLGRHRENGVLAAIKFVPAGVSPRERALFARECRLMAVLRHPNIVNVFEIGDGYLVTEYVEGQDLRHRLRAPLEPRFAVHVARTVAGALQHAHDRGIVHRDVKPANILLDRQGNVYLADFGIARLTGEAEDDLTAAGTPGYMAPEQRAGSPPGPEADQYSLGRTLAAMLAGRPLPRDPLDALAALSPSIPAALRAIIARATHPAPSQRFPSVGAFADALRDLPLADAPTLASLSPPLRSPEPFGWCRGPVAVVELGGGLVRADYRLSALAGKHLDADACRRVLDRVGYEDLGWSVYMRTERLGAIDDPSAFARAHEVVTLVHGLFTTRTLWSQVAVRVARDNAKAIVLTPDFLGAGESRFRDGGPAFSMRAVIDNVLEWLALLGLKDTPTVLAGHSWMGNALLDLGDDGLPEHVVRAVVTPMCTANAPGVVARVRVARWVARFKDWIPSFLLPTVVHLTMRVLVDYPALTAAERDELAQSAIRMPARRIVHMLSLVEEAAAHIRPMGTGLYVVTPDDPYLPAAIRATVLEGVPQERIFRLTGGGHIPQHNELAHPERTTRHIDELAMAVDAALDMTRTVATASELSGPETAPLPGSGVRRVARNRRDDGSGAEATPSATGAR